MKNVALITGAGGGLGMEFASIHARTGGDLVLVGKNKSGLKKLKKTLEQEHGIHAIIVVQDLSQEHAGKAVYDFVKKHDITVQYLINNAGFGNVAPFHKQPWKTQKDMIYVNAVAVAELTYYFLQDFIKQGSGRILNVSSIAGELPGPQQAMYYATKAFVTSLSNAISYEIRGTGVTLTTLKPGPTKTGFGKISGMDGTGVYKHLANASDVARTGYTAMLKGAIETTVGAPLSQRFALRFSKFIPKQLLLAQVDKQQKKH